MTGSWYVAVNQPEIPWVNKPWWSTMNSKKKKNSLSAMPKSSHPCSGTSTWCRPGESFPPPRRT